MRIASLPDLYITIPTLSLLSLGILVIYSSDPNLAFQQVIFALIGLVIYFVISLLDIQSYKAYFKYLYLFAIFLLLIVFVIGAEVRGSWRWIPLGFFQFQPSELAKPILILLLAKFWSENHPSWKNILKSFLIILPIFALIFNQPDLGTSLTILAIWLMMLIGANISMAKLTVMGITALTILPLSWFFLKDYQKNRILTFIFPTHDPLGVGYNVIQSTIAAGSGELFGRGLGRGTQSRLQFLPEYRTDFIFASMAEELGFVGSVIVLLLYSAIVYRSLVLVANTTRKFGHLLIFGTLGMLVVQIVINIGMNIGILPITGITLPLLSYGGSSLISTLICLGFITSLSKYSLKKISYAQAGNW